MMIESSKIPDQFSGTAVRVLCLLMEAEATLDPITPTELARAVGVRTAAITQLLDGLEKRHLTYRKRSAFDRRSRLVGLTELGLALVKEMAKPIRRELVITAL